MPGRHPGGGTAYYHDDHKVQREFERLKRDTTDFKSQLAAIQSSVVSTPKEESKPQLVVPPPRLEATGIVYIDRLPLDPATMPAGTPSADTYRYEYYTTTHNYGKYVYGVIPHYLGILPQYLDPGIYADGQNPYHPSGTYNYPYLLTITDLHVIDIDPLHWTYTYTQPFPIQMGIPEVEPLDMNNLIIRAFIKPELRAYHGGTVPPQNYDTWTSVDEGGYLITHVRTNLVFRWSIKKLSNL